MADELNITKSLFGAGPLAFGIDPAQDDLQRLERGAIATAGLDAMQQARYIANRGASLAGYGLGKAAIEGGLFGEEAKDPRVKFAQTAQGIMRQLTAEGFSFEDPVAVKQEVARRLIQNGFPQQGTMLAQEAQSDALGALKSRADIAAKRAATEKDLAAARNEQSPLQKLIGTGKFTPASLDLYQKTGVIADLELADDKYEKVETADGVFMVNKTNPDDRVRLGDNKQTESTDMWMMKKWENYLKAATDPKTGKVDWNRLPEADRNQAKAIAASGRMFGKEGVLSFFGDLAVNLGVEEQKALAGVLRAENFDKEFTGIANQWLPKGNMRAVAEFQAALSQAGQQGIAPAVVMNKLKDPEAARYISSAIRYINAILRRESGAAVTEAEWNRYAAGYIPMPNDTPEAIAEKERARKVWPQTEIDAFSPAMKNAYKNASSRMMDMTPGAKPPSAAKVDRSNPLVAAAYAAKRDGKYNEWYKSLSKEEKAQFNAALKGE